MIQQVQLQKWKKVSVPALPLGPPTSTPQPVAGLTSPSGLQERLSPPFAWKKLQGSLPWEKYCIKQECIQSTAKTPSGLTSWVIYFRQSTFCFRASSFSIETYKLQLEYEISSTSDMQLQYITNSLLVIWFWAFFLLLFAWTLITYAD